MRSLYRSGAIVLLAAAGGLILGGGTVTASDPFGGHDQEADTAAAREAELRWRQADFLRANPGAAMRADDRGVVTRVYGKSFAGGATPLAAAEEFLAGHARMFGVDHADLVAGASHLPAGRFAVDAVTDPVTGEPTFTVVYHQQVHDGLPVYGARVSTLVRNEPGNPVVLVNPDVRDLRGAEIDLSGQGEGLGAAARAVIESRFGPATEIVTSDEYIWAGLDRQDVQPRLALVSEVRVDGWDEWRVVTDANTGATLHVEHRICTVDVNGTVEARVTEGIGAEQCEDEVATPLPYVTVSAPGASTVTDVDGIFTLDQDGGSFVTVTAGVDGMYFDVFNFAGPEAEDSVTVAPPGPANLLLNEDNDDPRIRADVNAYYYSNLTRDWVLAVNSTYPEVAGRLDFPINTNQSGGLCPGNAWYSPGERSINFCLAGGGFPNTAWSSVVMHEYGHHLIEAGGSGQGQYGEGVSDCIQSIILDTNLLGVGFFGSCGEALRDPVENVRTYPCSGGIHDCGQLISGCIWETRNELVITEPDDYQMILFSLMVNSILVHSGSTISPDITIDWLTLDDDDDNIFNGTPHYAEIAAGFGSRNMDAPELAILDISFPDGRPDFVDPSGGTTVRVEVTGLTGTPQPGTGTLHVDLGGGFVDVPMSEIEPNVYDAVFPPSDCGATIGWFVSAETVTGTVITFPPDGADDALQAVSAAGIGAVAFEDDFEMDSGWTVTNQGGLSDGAWTRGVPVGGGDRGDPPTDGDGSGSCFVTDNVDGNSDVDDGTTILTSPQLDASGEAVAISYQRWYSNTFGNNPMSDIFVVEVSDDNGGSWTELEVVGPAGDQVDGGWFSVTYPLGDIPGFEFNDQFRIRFIASDLGGGSVVEAGVDGVELFELDCAGSAPCVGDIAGDDGVVDAQDLLALLAAWGTSGAGADIAEPLDTVDAADLLGLLAAYGDCP